MQKIHSELWAEPRIKTYRKKTKSNFLFSAILAGKGATTPPPRHKLSGGANTSQVLSIYIRIQSFANG
jgi:hypothetical protein